ncbi:MAG: class II glutamine amidotransferase [Lachnospiraceae bacterium]|nr:class II glutamine amidotransferase [Lachnospiraceae bacterium]
MCCLFGLIDYKGYFTPRQKNRVLAVLAKECEARGTDATGIAYNLNGGMKIIKAPLPAHAMRFRIPPQAMVIMGHTRMTTQGSEKKNRNNHPFHGAVRGMEFSLAHNGVLNNDKSLRVTEKLPSTDIQTDSYVAVQLLQKKQAITFESLKFMAEQVEGSFCFTVLDCANNFYIVKGSNPICIYQYEREGFYIYASTEEILKKAISRMGLYMPKRGEKVNVSCGDIVKFSPTGSITKGSFSYNSLDDLWLMERYRPYSDCTTYYKSVCTDIEQERLEELKWMATCFGFEPEEVEVLYKEGYTLDEVEELLYQCEY